jgi:alpha-tubulin suppressor-like RCC1 family protein
MPGEILPLAGVAVGRYHLPGGPEPVVIETYTLAILGTGEVMGWGSNPHGQTDLPSDLTDVVAVSTQSKHCLALTGAGMVRAWGLNDRGQCDVPDGLDEVVAIETGSRSSYALRRDGTLAIWGEQPGGSEYRDAPSPMGRVAAIAAGTGHALALSGEGEVFAWGKTNKGQGEEPSELPAVSKIAANLDTSAALTRGGQIIAWGTFDYRSEEGVRFVDVLVAEDGSLLGKKEAGGWTVLRAFVAWPDVDLADFNEAISLAVSHYAVLGVVGEGTSLDE